MPRPSFAWAGLTKTSLPPKRFVLRSYPTRSRNEIFSQPSFTLSGRASSKKQSPVARASEKWTSVPCGEFRATSMIPKIVQKGGRDHTKGLGFAHTDAARAEVEMILPREFRNRKIAPAENSPASAAWLLVWLLDLFPSPRPPRAPSGSNCAPRGPLCRSRHRCGRDRDGIIRALWRRSPLPR